jgi:CheY-like chemotaxis protein
MTDTDVLSADAEPRKLVNNDADAKPIVLVVDDSLVQRRVTSRLVEKDGLFEAIAVTNGREALHAIEKKRPDVVLTDLQMPEMNGLELVANIRSQYPLVPVILMTAEGSEEIAHQALRAGAASYVPKVTLARDLAETLMHVVAAAQVDQRRERALAALKRRESHYRLENDPDLVPPFATLLQEDLAGLELDHTTRTRVGMALQAALLNALYHGNLELDPKLREQGDGPYQELARKRCRQAPYVHRRIHVYVNLVATEVTYVVRDEGRGYDIKKLPSPAEYEKLGKSCGRGLLLISNFMDQITLNGNGNQITMTKRRNAKAAGDS